MSEPTEAGGDLVDIQIVAPALSPAAQEAFAADVRIAGSALDHLREARDLPPGRVRVILADDFVGQVDHWMTSPARREEGESFSPVREGWTVVAKNLHQTDDASDVVIVFDASFWMNAEDRAVRARLAGIVAHELAHRVIERARYASGAMDGVLLPSVTGSEVARNMVRIMAGEYRADVIGELIAGSYITMTIDGEVRPCRMWTVEGPGYVESIRELLAGAIPRWPDVVDEYRNWRIALEQMFGTLVPAIDQTLTLLIHAQAGADIADADVDILGLPEIASLRATEVYLADTLPPFLELLRTTPVLGTLEETRDLEERIVATGEPMVLEIWSRLGLTVLERDDRERGVKVDEPRR